MVVACGDAPEVFDFEEEALDEVTLAIEGVVASDLRRCFPGWDDRDGIAALDGFAKRFGIVALITQDIVCGQVGDEGFGLGDVALLSRRQDEA